MGLARPTTPASVELKASLSSRFVGVGYGKNLKGGNWAASITVANAKNQKIANFHTEEEAALAVDRVALYLGWKREQLNFPDVLTKPATIAQVRKEEWATFKDHTTSQYRGVYWRESHSAWHAAIRYEGRRVSLGQFDDELKAARAYDEAARRLHGERAHLNFPTKEERAAVEARINAGHHRHGKRARGANLHRRRAAL